MNLNFDDRISNSTNSSRSKLIMEFPLKESTKHKYVPVLPMCNDTDHSEVEDLNKPALESSKEKSESTTDHSIVPTSIEEQRKNKTYINIQDHQRNNETSSDIPVYDPNKIPYVDVPDYSDIREESLDEEDRRENSRKTKQDVGLKKSTESLKGSKFENDIEDKILKDSKKSREKDPKENFLVNRVEENNEDEILRDFKQNVNGKKSSNSESKNDPEINSGRNEDSGSKEDSDELWQRGNRTRQAEPVIFDINEYRKPFNLDEFLKDDPIMKKLELLGKETHTMYGKSRKRVPGFFNESESDNASKDWAEEQEESAKERDDFDYFSKSRSGDFDDAFANIEDYNGSNEKSKGARNRENFNADEFLSTVFAEYRKESDVSRFGNDAEILSRYFTDDGIRNSREDASVEGDREWKDAR
ncbi:uncharacterized protein LOC143345475 [Colletes latitarsis]|uniref:uncharacterized protein LOC143345475 n=1 Tax=Colletes latitarsis TaxID=2605962 RepID=UPI004036F128